MRDFDVITAVVLSTAVFMGTNFISLTLDDASVDSPVWTSDTYLNFTLSFGADEQLLRNMQHAIRLPNGEVLHSIPEDMIDEVVDGFVVGDLSLLTWTATALPALAVLIAAACVVTAWVDNILPSKRPDPAGGERLRRVNVIVKWFGSLGAWFAITTLWQGYIIYAWEFTIPDRSILDFALYLISPVAYALLWGMLNLPTNKRITLFFCALGSWAVIISFYLWAVLPAMAGSWLGQSIMRAVTEDIWQGVQEGLLGEVDMSRVADEL